VQLVGRRWADLHLIDVARLLAATVEEIGTPPGY
jgi:hypothetical protein